MYKFSVSDMLAGNYGSRVHENKEPAQDDEYDYRDSL